MSGSFRRYAAAAAAAVALPTASIGLAVGLTPGVAGATPTAGSATEVTTAPPPPMVCHRDIEIGNRSVYEGTRTSTTQDPYTYLTFTILSSGCAREGALEWFTLGGSASAQFDYLPASGALRFVQGDLGPRTVTVRVVKDGSPGSAETLYVALTDASSSIDLEDPVGAGTILNDDTMCVPPPELPPGYPDYHCSE